MLDKQLVINLINSDNPFPVSFDEAWQWLEYSRKNNAKVAFLNCDFVQGVDFQLLNNQQSDNHAGLSAQEKAVAARTETIVMTIDCFKSWAMMSGTEKGKQVRQYFLDCERELKQFKQDQQYNLPKSFAEALRLAASLEEEKQLLQQQAEVNAPKVEFYDTIIDLPDCIDMGQAAQLLKIPYKNGYLGRNKMFEILREIGVLTANNRPYQKFVNNGCFKLTEVTYQTKFQKQVYVKTMITNKGLQFIRREIAYYLDSYEPA